MKSSHILAAGLVLLAALPLVPVINGQAEAAAQCGRASWYALTSRTASGEMADPGEMTAAHRRLPFGTKVKVRNLRNDRTVTVRINDRGPFIGGRVIDVTRAAAQQLGFVSAGTTPVAMTIIESNGRERPGC